jgi:hypothetical protein
MNIEDLIVLLAMQVKLTSYDSKIISSFYDQISKGIGFTEKQANLAVKILHQQASALSLLLSTDINLHLISPTYRYPLRTLNVNKTISIIDHPEFTKAIKLVFPYNEQIVERIKKNRSKTIIANWDNEEKAWIFALNEQAIDFLTPLISDYHFIPDDTFAEYADQVRYIHEHIEDHIPMVSTINGKPTFLNTFRTISQPNTDNILESLFLARKVGIHTWDDSVSAYIDTQSINPYVMDFLNENPGTTFSVNLDVDSISGLADIVKYLSPCVFIIPGGSEIEKVTASLDMLKLAGISNNEISILFRLPKQTGEKFNEFVRDNKLNNPITKNTKVVFISSKLPKTIIDPNIKFNCIVNFNFYSVHYTIREFIKNHHNVINVLGKNQQRTLNFGIL